jgi:hypothetical protein
MRMHLENMCLFRDVNKDSVSDIRIIRIGNGDDVVDESGVEVRYFGSPEAAADYAHNLVINNTERN